MTGNDLPLDAPAGTQNLVSVQPDWTVLGLREKKMHIVGLAKQSIQSGLRSFRDVTKHFHDAAEYLAAAQELRVSQRELADEVGMSAAWVNSLLRWRERGYPDRTPFTQRPPAKAVQQTEQSSWQALASPQGSRDRVQVAASSELAKTDKLDVGTETHIQEEAEVTAPDDSVNISAPEGNWTNDTFSVLQREHLIEALEMLASDRPKYRAKHALAVETRRAELGLTWDKLLIPANEVEAGTP
jgi:hypothetical protein